MQTCFLVLLLFSGTLPHLQFYFSSFDSSRSPGCAITSMPPPLPWAPQVLPTSPERPASARLTFPRAVPRDNRISSPELAGKGRQVLPPTCRVTDQRCGCCRAQGVQAAGQAAAAPVPSPRSKRFVWISGQSKYVEWGFPQDFGDFLTAFEDIFIQERQCPCCNYKN